MSLRVGVQVRRASNGRSLCKGETEGGLTQTHREEGHAKRQAETRGHLVPLIRQKTQESLGTTERGRPCLLTP